MDFMMNPYRFNDVPDVWIEKDPLNKEYLEECPDVEFSGIISPFAKAKINCPHKKRIDYCLECGGSQMCKHKLVKANCVICDGSQLCHHKTVWSRCNECKITYACPHKRHFMHCKKCKQAKQKK